ncbi:MAG: hypothetical protein AB9917_13730 [Negativicutes bacterium]
MDKSQKSRSIDEWQKVLILLHEYDTLRTELIHRSNNLYQILTVGAMTGIASLGWIGSRNEPILAPIYIAIIIIFLLLAYLIFLVFYNIKKIAQRVREIEELVDKKTDENYLLQWERIWSSAVNGFGYFGASHHLSIPIKENKTSNTSNRA